MVMTLNNNRLHKMELTDREVRTIGEKRWLYKHRTSVIGSLAIPVFIYFVLSFVSYEAKKIRIVFQKPIEIPSEGSQQEKIAFMIQESANRFAGHIHEKTVDWHMLQRIWIDGDFEERA